MSATAGRDARAGATVTVPDPLRLCVYATIAALARWLGPFALLAFAGLGLIGYLRVCQAGLTRRRCVLRDTRLVNAYLVVPATAAPVGIGFVIADWAG